MGTPRGCCTRGIHITGGDGRELHIREDDVQFGHKPGVWKRRGIKSLSNAACHLHVRFDLKSVEVGKIRLNLSDLRTREPSHSGAAPNHRLDVACLSFTRHERVYVFYE